MIKITVTPEKILINNEKKIPFFKKIKTKELLLDNIKFVTREEYKGEFRALAILQKKGGSVYLINHKCENLEETYSLLIKYHKNYEISILDIDTMKETKVA